MFILRLVLVRYADGGHSRQSQTVQPEAYSHCPKDLSTVLRKLPGIQHVLLDDECTKAI